MDIVCNCIAALMNFRHVFLYISDSGAPEERIKLKLYLNCSVLVTQHFTSGDARSQIDSSTQSESNVISRSPVSISIFPWYSTLLKLLSWSFRRIACLKILHWTKRVYLESPLHPIFQSIGAFWASGIWKISCSKRIYLFYFIDFWYLLHK